jgi:AcrR family transcriptional regulator
MMKKTKESSSDVDEAPRRKALLEASIGVFARFGYRKTSMSDVARAAGFSRQGVYFYYANKDDLFKATVHHSFASRLDCVSEILEDQSLPIETKLVRALDEWEGRYVETLGEEAIDLIGASIELASSIMQQHNTLLERKFARALSAEPALVSAYRAGSVSPVQVARMLLAAAQVFKSKTSDRRAFRKEVEASVKLVLLPILREGKR